MTSAFNRVHLQCQRLGLVVVLLALSPPYAPLAAERRPLQKSKIEIGKPAPTPPELQGYDEDGNPIYWDPQPRVVPLADGKYAFKWTGHEGQELTIIYTRPDVVDVVVEAATEARAGNRIRYVYRVHNLNSGKENLGGFSVKTVSPEASVESQPFIFAVNPWQALGKQFPEGAWMSFAPYRAERQIRPGDLLEVVLLAADLPALVECRAHADTLTLKGAGEEMPFVLEDLILRRDAWPRGWTIGPDERMAKMALKERVKYLVERLPQMLELGWIENQKVMHWYEENLQPAKAAQVRARAEADFNKNLITSEVLALMTYLLR